jgi:uncharacterized protein (DUF427 family)
VLELLRRNNIAFKEKEVRSNRVNYDELVRISGQNKTPTLDIDGEILADSDAHQALHFLNQKGIKTTG